MNVGYITNMGDNRPINQDSLYMDESLGLFIVADGMGGHNAGEVAGKIAVEVAAKSIGDGLESGKDITLIFREAVSEANKSIYEQSMDNPAWSEMGTTLLMVFKDDHKVVIGHVGDSRAYVIRNGQIEQVTEDHTFVFQWLKDGLITPEEARTHNARHGLTAALGVSDEVEADIAIWPWEENTCLLMCSDGLTETVEDEMILAIVESKSEPQEACDRLVNIAREKGAKDDITVILVCD